MDLDTTLYKNLSLLTTFSIPNHLICLVEYPITITQTLLELDPVLYLVGANIAVSHTRHFPL